MTKCVKRKQYGNRTYSHKDLWRIYCNNLTQIEQGLFLTGMSSTKGSCDSDFHPCTELIGLTNDYKVTIDSIKNDTDLITGLIDQYIGGYLLQKEAEVKNGFEKFRLKILQEYSGIGTEDELSWLDDLLIRDIPDPIERSKLVKNIFDRVDESAAALGGGFVNDLEDLEDITINFDDIAIQISDVPAILKGINVHNIDLNNLKEYLDELQKIFNDCEG